jgi:LPS export ABC transporter protein LptC
MKGIYFVFRYLSVVLFFAFITSCENDIEKVNLITEKNNAPVESGKDMEILYSDSGKVKVKITTPELHRYQLPRPRTELPLGVQVDFFDNDLHVTSTLTSKYALRNDDDRTMIAKKDVVIVNEKGEKLMTEYLVWDEKAGKIFSNEFVKIITKDEIIFGNGFESNQDFTRYKIFDIKGTINLRKDENAKNS